MNDVTIPARVRLGQLRVDARFFVSHLLVNLLIGSPALPRLVRPFLLRMVGYRVARSTLFPRIVFLGRACVSIDCDAMVNWGVVFDNKAEISIGARTHVGHEVLFCTTSHELGNGQKRAGGGFSSPIVVGAGCWIGARTIILPGVQVGNGCVIAAGSVVTSDCEANALYAGVPAVIKKRFS